MSTNSNVANLSITVVKTLVKMAGFGPVADMIDGGQECLNLLADIKNDALGDPNAEMIRGLNGAVKSELDAIENALNQNGMSRKQIKQAVAQLSDAARQTIKDLAEDDNALIRAVQQPQYFAKQLRGHAAPLPNLSSDEMQAHYETLLDRIAEEFLTLAPWSPNFDHVALTELLRCFPALTDQIARVKHEIQVIGNKVDAESERSREADADTHRKLDDLKDMVGSFTPTERKPLRVAFGSRPDVVAGDRFIERGEQEQLNSLIADPMRRRTVLVGMRGCGKTQLAAALAKQCEDANWSLVAWVNAVSPESIKSALVELAKQLQIDTSDQPAQNVIIRRGLDHLKSADPAARLIVFDNVEDINHLRELVPTGDGLRVVATTTNDKGWNYQGWDPIRIGVFDRETSIDYLLTVTDSADREAAYTLAERLGDLPLALAQAAATARNGNLSLDRYLDRLDSYGSERVIHPIPGDFYTDDVTTALWMAVEEAYEAMKYDIKVRARRQIGALALLAESGIPTQWLDPTIEQRGNREVEDTREAADENAHDALNELIRRNIIQQSADRRTAILHRVEAHAVRSQWDADEEADARDAAVELLFNVDVESLAFTDTDGRLRCTRDLIHQLHSAASQEHSQTIFTDERILTTIDNTLQYAELTGIPAETIKLHSAIDIITQVHGQNNYRVQIARNDLADAYMLSGVHSVANTLYTLKGFGRLLSPKPIFDAEILELVEEAEKYHAEHNYKQAISTYKRAVSKCHPVTGPSDKYIIDTRLSLANAYNEAGMTENAIQQYTKAIEEAPVAYGPNHPYTDKLLELLALLHIRTDNYDEAISILNCIHSNRKRIFGNENELTLQTLATLCDAYMSTNQPKKVISLLEQIDEVRRPKSLHTTVINLLRIRLADAYYANNDFYAAIDSYKSFINHLNEVYADIDADSIEQMFYILDLSEAQTGLAWALYDTQDTEHIRQAIALMQKTAQECKLTMGPENWRTINANETLSFFKSEAAKAAY